MNSNESVQIKVGLFVFAGLFLAMIMIFFLGSEKQLFKRQYTLKSFYDDISGLRVGAQVQLAGVNVGMVDGIYFSRSPKDQKVTVHFSIDKDYQDRIREDSVAAINTQGLLGDKIVAISVGNPEKRVLQNGDILPSQEGKDIFSMASKGGEIMENVNKTSKVLTSILEEVSRGDGLMHTLIYETPERPVGRDFSEMTRELRTSSTELKNILQRIERGEGTIGGLISDPSLYNDIRRLFGKMERNNLLRYIIRSRIRDLELEKVNGSASESPQKQ